MLMSGSLPTWFGVGVMAVVLAGPPAVAQPDQQVAVHQTGDVVGPPGPEDLLVAGLMPEEADLAKQGRQVHRHQQLEPGVAEHREQRDARGQQQRQHSDLDRVVAGPPGQQARAADEAAQLGVIAAAGGYPDNGPGHHCPRSTAGPGRVPWSVADWSAGSGIGVKTGVLRGAKAVMGAKVVTGAGGWRTS